MTLSTDDLHELIRLLEQHPEWRAELRRLVLTEELLGLPGLTRELAGIVREMARSQQQGLERLERVEVTQARLAEALTTLAEAQRRTEERLDALTVRVDALAARLDALAVRMDELAEAQRHTEERLQQLTARVDALAARVDELAEAQRRTEERLEQLATQVSVLADTVQRMADDLGRLKGWSLEERARRKAHALFRSLIRRPRLVSEEQFAQLVDDAQDQGTLSPKEADRLIEADVVVRGQQPDDRSEVYLIAEVSWGIGVKDVQRARERATLARRIGLPAQPVVVGTWVTPEAERLIQHDGTLVLLIRPDDWAA
uniref:Chromosome partition protein Smc n=1 Tax=Thermorudis peleae TaxID=1382356 RepID=A0A831TFU8_9BACT